MNNIFKFFCTLTISAALCGCAKETSEVTPVNSETSAVTTTTTFNAYALVRTWTAEELLESIYFCGEYHKLPLNVSENTGFVLSGNSVSFPDGSSATAVTDSDGNIIGLDLERGTAPSDLSVLGIDFSSVPDDITEKVGIAEYVYGDKAGTVTYSFYGGGIRELSFYYTDYALQRIYICMDNNVNS